jgi:hypothetical protein
MKRRGRATETHNPKTMKQDTAVEQVKPPAVEEIKAPVVTTKPKATPEKVSILWGLFTWQKG